MRPVKDFEKHCCFTRAVLMYGNNREWPRVGDYRTIWRALRLKRKTPNYTFYPTRNRFRRRVRVCVHIIFKRVRTAKYWLCIITHVSDLLHWIGIELAVKSMSNVSRNIWGSSDSNIVLEIVLKAFECSVKRLPVTLTRTFIVNFIIDMT